MEAPQRKRIGPQTVAYLDHSGPYSDIASVYHQLYAWAKQAGVKPAGPAFTVFLQSPDELNWQAGRFEVCLPIPRSAAAAGPIPIKSLPATDVLAILVSGPYADMPAHYSEFLAWIDVESAAITGPPREIYLVHPAASGSGDPKTFRTEIQFPVAPEE
jgi:AraC family transcriptional regulator